MCLSSTRRKAFLSLIVSLSTSKMETKFFMKETVKMKDPQRVAGILRKLVEGGPRKLQIVTDFDYTLTKVHNGGGEASRLECSWGVLENSRLMPPEYVEATKALKQKYRPYEVDPTLTVEEKIPYIVTWYERANELLKKFDVKRKDFRTMVEASDVDLRDGVAGLMKAAAAAKIPVLILSAGMGDLVEEILRQKNVYLDNVKVVSNFLLYEDNGNGEEVVKGLKQPMIHVFNKNESSVHDSPYFKERRTNVVLLGDSLGDLSMADGIPDPEILNIGFLNEKFEDRLETYMEKYDIVLVDDQTMDVPNAILEKIIS